MSSPIPRACGGATAPRYPLRRPRGVAARTAELILLVAATLLATCARDATRRDAATADENVLPAAAVAAGEGDFRPCASFPKLCADELGESDLVRPAFSNPVQIVPGKLPPQIVPKMANNNLGVAWFAHRLFVAFRTASHHHPRADASIEVISTEDLQRWSFEGHFALSVDMREPLLFVVNDKLFLNFSLVEPSYTNFRPLGPRSTQYIGPGRWTTPQPVLAPGMIVWRVKTIDGQAYLNGYAGLDGLFDYNSVTVRWMKSSDGKTWTPVGRQSAVLKGGNTESDFVFLSDGSMVAITRNEVGDETGYGSKLCRASANDLGQWTCVPSRHKYDSPLMFRHGRVVYLIGRRNVTASGDYDLHRNWLPTFMRSAFYQFAYWNRPKRCALWQVDPNAMKVDFIADLPSRGDTCFPGLLKLDRRRYLVFNYTSPLDGRDLTWRQGQNGPTAIYYSVLTMPEDDD